MKKFMDSDFLLTNEISKRLYLFAEKVPICDFHCHLSVKEIAENKSYKNITEIWLNGDHYKWRAMRSNGIEEKYITGDASDYDKFLAYAETLEYAYGNPIFHWSHLELKRYFGITEILSRKTAKDVWIKANKLLEKNEYRAKELILNSNVKILCTTDDPIDSLIYHKQIKEDKDFSVKVLPTFRTDKAFKIEKEEYINWILKLEKIVNRKIDNFENFIKALEDRVKFFKNNGCVVTDSSIETPFYRRDTKNEIDNIFKKRLLSQDLSLEEIEIYKTELFIRLGEIYSKYGLVMQIHIGALRNNNEKMFNLLGEDTGFDSIGDYSYAFSLSKLLSDLNNKNKLCKSIIYCLNPKDNEMIGSMIGNFQDSEIAGKIQFGSAWWFNDNKKGMREQMMVLSNFGLLRRFIGMLTDSRSFLSYVRHEYFRRVLCDLLGEWVENGEIPYDDEILKKMIEEICFHNAIKYFDLKIENGEDKK